MEDKFVHLNFTFGRELTLDEIEKITEWIDNNVTEDWIMTASVEENEED